jgi:hypothetical protein
VDDPIIFRETGAKWFRLAGIALAVRGGFAALTVAFAFHQPRRSGLAGSDLQALAAIIAVAALFAICFGALRLVASHERPPDDVVMRSGMHEA